MAIRIRYHLKAFGWLLRKMGFGVAHRPCVQCEIIEWVSVLPLRLSKDLDPFQTVAWGVFHPSTKSEKTTIENNGLCAKLKIWKEIPSDIIQQIGFDWIWIGFDWNWFVSRGKCREAHVWPVPVAASERGNEEEEAECDARLSLWLSLCPHLRLWPCGWLSDVGLTEKSKEKHFHLRKPSAQQPAS